MTDSIDTIAAVATPPGRGGIAIVRISGPRVSEITDTLLGIQPPPRTAVPRVFRDRRGDALDHGLALYFPGPRSFTGEDILELHGHGGPMVADMVLREVLAAGARMARPGEFSERAFLNGKIDLAQAEAIADLIESASEEAARGALRSLQGEFSRRVESLVERLVTLRTYIEAAIDFSDEEVELLADGDIGTRLAHLREELDVITADARQGALLREGMHVVIAGRPNAGKSSLLNCLARREAAIVTDVPGTTRDVLREAITIDGLPVHISDTAGLRETAEPVERIGVERARAAIGQADRILLVVDDAAEAAGRDIAEFQQEFPADARLTIVYNKIDISGRSAGTVREVGLTGVAVSARTGDGIDALRAHLKDCVGYRAAGEGGFSARRRHLDALARAARDLEQGASQLFGQDGGELLAEDLRQAQRALSEITGEFTSDDLLGRIFASFCIGK